LSGAPLWVYTEGVFDLFHAGHVEFLRQARQLGDRLVVGLVSDADTATYKPPPILTFEERQAVVGACRYVDRVLSAPSPLITTSAFLDEIGAAFCCHGDDFDAATLEKFYGDLIPKGRLKTVRYTANISSRDIVKRIAARSGDAASWLQRT
jgi:cytidyltransferase-like protein